MRIGILGTGQLGQMLSLAGIPLGHSFLLYDLNQRTYYDSLNPQRQGVPATLQDFASMCDVLTYESENTPLSLLSSLQTPIYPGLLALEVSQHRVTEKTFFQNLKIPTTRFQPIYQASDLEATSTLTPLLLKTCTLGYDGKGQVLVQEPNQLEAAWRTLGEQPCIAEALIQFKRELSIIGCRDLSGNIIFYPLTENIHHAGILRISRVPLYNAEHLQALAESYLQKIFEATDYCGILSLELFDTTTGLIANEMAPRVHNSGHWTQEGSSCGQFENHIRAITGLPLGKPICMAPAIAMINFISTIPPLTPLLSKPHYHVHLYGKEARPQRKLGHLTILAQDQTQLNTEIETLSYLYPVELSL